MKNISKLICLVLAFVMLLCGCDTREGTKKPSSRKTNTMEATQDTAPTEPEEPKILTEDELRSALDAGGYVVLGADLTLSKEVTVTSNTVLDCGGFTITGPELQKAIDEETQKTVNVADTENALTVRGGTVQNVTIKGAYRGIGDRKGFGVNGDVRLKNVDIDSQTYVINFGYGDSQSCLYAENSTFRGWSSYTKFKEAQFTNCTFAWDSTGGNGNLRPYINTTLINCKFEGKTEADGTVTPFNLNFASNTDGVVLTLENCYVGDTLITEENINDLLNVNVRANTIRIQNTAE